MLTRWGRSLDKDSVLTEYPRPQMKRESYLCLNGEWDYAITPSNARPDSWDGKIIVPFSPECELSGVMRTVMPTDRLWYECRFTLPEGFNIGRVLLHFGAVDQQAAVWLNGQLVCEHTGGYTPFSADITDCLATENTLTVRVIDLSDTSYHSRGKQKTKRGGIWYTAQSGIWQTVWLESVPQSYIRSLRMTPLYDESALELTAFGDDEITGTAVLEDGRRFTISANVPCRIGMSGFTPWSPEYPKLYSIAVSLGEDSVESYFGMRKFSVETDDKGIRRLFLNGKPYFHNGLLDQGYYPDGLYTAPSDEAMIYDIETMKTCGFNMLRKHIKLEPLRWYYHCDRLGMLVWQDMMNGGGEYRFSTISFPLVTGVHHRDSSYGRFARRSAEGREQYYRELDELVDTLYNSVSVAVWVPFNEGWGQFDAPKAVERILAKDKTRTIDHASGWHDQKLGEVKSLHVYFKPYRFKKDRLGRAVVLSEFGGYNCRLDGHCFNEKDFGYKRAADKDELLRWYKRLYEKEIIPAKQKGLSAAVYTQLSDVEDELNGLVTYDREIEKLPREELAALNKQLSDR